VSLAEGENDMDFLRGIFEKISAKRQYAKDKKQFFEDLITAAEIGRLTDDEIQQIQKRYQELGLTQDDLKGVRAQAYEAALGAAKSDGVLTAEEAAKLAKLERILMIPESEIAKAKKELTRLQLLTDIQNGNPPTVAVPNVILQKGEVAYWSEPASLLEERVVRRRYEGGSQGFSFRIAKGVYYRVGGHRGHIVTDTAVVAVSAGELIITNKRVIFRGNTKAFNIRIDNLLELNFYNNGVRLTDNNGKLRIVKFDDEANSDVVAAILTYAINHFGG